jgi:hypothetical protein
MAAELPFTVRTVATALKAARSAGLPVYGYRVRPDGEVVVLTTEADARKAAPRNEWDE